MFLIILLLIIMNANAQIYSREFHIDYRDLKGASISMDHEHEQVAINVPNSNAVFVYQVALSGDLVNRVTIEPCELYDTYNFGERYIHLGNHTLVVGARDNHAFVYVFRNGMWEFETLMVDVPSYVTLHQNQIHACNVTQVSEIRTRVSPRQWDKTQHNHLVGCYGTRKGITWYKHHMIIDDTHVIRYYQEIILDVARYGERIVVALDSSDVHVYEMKDHRYQLSYQVPVVGKKVYVSKNRIFIGNGKHLWVYENSQLLKMGDGEDTFVGNDRFILHLSGNKIQLYSDSPSIVTKAPTSSSVDDDEKEWYENPYVYGSGAGVLVLIGGVSTIMKRRKKRKHAYTRIKNY